MRLIHLGVSILFGGLLAVLGGACSIPAGERCLPDAYDNPCGDGFTCTTPPNCLVSVCCPSPNQTIPGPDIPAGCLSCLVDTSGGSGGSGGSTSSTSGSAGGSGGSMSDAGAK